MSYKVLIVEDDPMVAMINGQYITKNPLFTVAENCRSGLEALEYLKNNSVDLIVLDVFMPYMDGIETLKKIRENKIQAEVIMVTAANDTATLEETMHLGIIDYLIKPFAYERFQVALEKFVSQKKILERSSVLDQKSIDNMISASGQKKIPEISEKIQLEESPLTEKELPKGIQKKTLNKIKNYISENPHWQTVNAISEKLGISIVTARHYLTYLEEDKFIISEINYDTGGRPSVLYKKR